ncbi:hypothetical protein [Emticicia sp. BO119]|uniref:hypothetical protein n=1 Tax=Emticicia sp. BO119 TaxID=2757768 RepID=UPI0015F102D6|nr:hypothetical protein [Emticicia sp. BO119]MBA4849457.1 hypothetical protein [Emticicia sp. BO119]
MSQRLGRVHHPSPYIQPLLTIKMLSKNHYIQSFPTRDLFLKSAIEAINNSKAAFLIYNDDSGELSINFYALDENPAPLSNELYGRSLQLKSPEKRILAKTHKQPVPNHSRTHFLKNIQTILIDAKSVVLIVDDINVLNFSSDFYSFGLPEKGESLFNLVWEAYQIARLNNDDEDLENEDFD